ncbi:HlyD family secretion protein [Desulforamulus ruminis]|uniref:Secretion protein HlyD family protein n=1 Tax=Desulforamulus ruminis (strain ATCC 23193 / DSM 2154 / NCIMB 8452 / DL) TaxID=696281 RepID=F6DNC1_DESRL|nr:HlyD family efflux transporter periplasmic adaptor subunit [Desulforamulus ruminis]AEG61812.1 secretion protein HlyD family protein [Desulforamulus ruminis DSM 2154]
MDELLKVQQKKKKILLLFLSLMILAALILGGYFYKIQTKQAREQESLTATGTLEATRVMASFKVAGRMDALLVDEGARVKKGDLLATLEPKELQAKLSQAQGAHEAALAASQQASEAVPLTRQQVEATIAQCQAKVEQAAVKLRSAKQLYDRMVELHKAGAISDSQLEDATNNYDAAQQQQEEAKAALAQAEAARLQVEVSQAQYDAAVGQVNQAQGALEEAKAYLENSQLKAAMDGFITQKYLEQGEMLNAGTPVFEITDLEHTFVKVFISEKKIGRVHLGQQAEIRVLAFPDKVFKGKVVFVNNAGDFAVKKAVNEQNQHDIRSFEVKIDVPNQDLLLKVGMTATVRILEE